MSTQLEKIKIAAQIIKNGGIVVFPTETVYGLGADAFNEKAVEKIFKVKKRPFNDPLILHVSNKEWVFKLVENVPKIAVELMDKFWPGPLTLIFKKSKIVPDITTAGLPTVAIRMPKNSVSLKLIKYSQTPIAAPSANLFGKPSATKMEHVIKDLGNKVDFILDGGEPLIGIESTILDLTKSPPELLRAGALPIKEIASIVDIKISGHGRAVRSPGMFPKHYSPKAKLIVVKKRDEIVSYIQKLAQKYKKEGKKVGILSTEENKNKYSSKFCVKGFGEKYQNLYSALREFDTEGIKIIIAEGVEENGLGLAVMDRLYKASGKWTN